MIAGVEFDIPEEVRDPIDPTGPVSPEFCIKHVTSGWYAQTALHGENNIPVL